MGKKCRVVDNGSSSDQNSHGLTSSVSVNKPNKQNSGNADVSADALKRSDVNSEIAQAPLKEKRKNPSDGGTKEISQVPRKQLKPDSSSLEANGGVGLSISVPRAVESKKVLQGLECSITTKSDPKFDLNEGTEANEPIPVVAKLGVPKGLPVKPLSFGGEHGWNRSGINSAFREKAPVSKGFNFDLNIAATMDPEVPSLPCNSGIDLNNDPIIEDASKGSYPQGETRQLLPNCNILGTGTRTPYWVDLSSVRGFGNVQSRPFLMSAPTTEQAQINQMVVPIQMPYTPPGLYIGKMNGFTPAFYPPNILPPLCNQPVAGPHFSAYPGSVRLLESSQGLSLNPRPYLNTRQTIFPNGGIALMEHGSRNHLFEQRLKPVDQAVCPPVSMTRREPDTGWVASQVTQSLL
ncbi:uncharacterized protein LOC141604904 [Silene latifolia]|uniref:uncharacterized protein LOC141604904 n=1 Tax=Silene latifolia TaxID=37657 RepID=UPI003D7895B8